MTIKPDEYIQFEGQVRRDDVLLPRLNELQRTQYYPTASADLPLPVFEMKFQVANLNPTIVCARA